MKNNLEKYCQKRNESDKNIKYFVYRLPEFNTDQNYSIFKNNNKNNLNLLYRVINNFLNEKKVSIIKYSKAGNIGSLRNTILRITDKKFDICLTDNSVDIKKSDIIILPGVGNFKETMEDLTNKKFNKIYKKSLQKKQIFVRYLCRNAGII